MCLRSCALAVWVVGCSQSDRPPSPAWLVGGDLDAAIESAFSLLRTDDLRADVAQLASDSLGGRNAGYAGELIAARYVAARMREAGLRPAVGSRDGDYTFFQEFQFHPRSPPTPWAVLESRNVLGWIEGSDPVRRREIVVVGAHYDGQGQAGEADPDRWPAIDASAAGDRIWNSADDNASGVAVMLAVARALATSKIASPRSILFAGFGAEEPGLIGSIWYVANPVFAWDRHVAMLNLEKLGRVPEQTVVAVTDGTSMAWADLLSRANDLTGAQVTSFFPGMIRDTDHYPFAARALPAMVLATVHEEDTHRPTDSWDKIDFPRLAERARFVFAITVYLANLPEPPEFNPAVFEPDPGLQLASATAAELRERGLDGGAGGLKIVGVLEGLPGDNAGLRIGDLLVSVDGSPLTVEPNTEVLDDAVADHPSRPVTLEVVRGARRFQVVLDSHRNSTAPR